MESRCVNHHRDMDELSTLEDSRTDSILQKYDSYKSNIRIASSKTRSISRQKHSEGLIFTTPRSVTKRENSLLHSVINNSIDTGVFAQTPCLRFTVFDKFLKLLRF